MYFEADLNNAHYKVDVVEGFRSNGLDDGHLIAHLIQLAQPFVFVEQDEARRGQRRVRESLFQFLAQQGGGTGNGYLVQGFLYSVANLGVGRRTRF